MRQKVDKERHVLLTYKRTSVHGEERTRRNTEKRRKDERERGEVSEGQWRSVGRTVEKCRRQRGVNVAMNNKSR